MAWTYGIMQQLFLIIHKITDRKEIKQNGKK